MGVLSNFAPVQLKCLTHKLLWMFFLLHSSSDLLRSHTLLRHHGCTHRVYQSVRTFHLSPWLARSSGVATHIVTFETSRSRRMLGFFSRSWDILLQQRNYHPMKQQLCGYHTFIQLACMQVLEGYTFSFPTCFFITLLSELFRLSKFKSSK